MRSISCTWIQRFRNVKIQFSYMCVTVADRIFEHSPSESHLVFCSNMTSLFCLSLLRPVSGSAWASWCRGLSLVLQHAELCPAQQAYSQLDIEMQRARIFLTFMKEKIKGLAVLCPECWCHGPCSFLGWRVGYSSWGSLLVARRRLCSA